MGYSHRDRRAYRSAFRDLEWVIAATLGLGILVMVLPWVLVALVALLTLGVVGGVSMLHAESLIGSYARDLAHVRAGSARDGFLRAEVTSDVGLERAIVRPSAKSPHRRKGPVRIEQTEDRPPGPTPP